MTEFILRHKFVVGAVVLFLLTAFIHQPQKQVPASIASGGSGGQSVTSSTASSCHAADNGNLPDPTCTPGATDPRVNQSNISSTICVQGYTKTVRPSLSQSTQIKHEQYAAYGYNASQKGELDHLVPLELGGAPSDTKNLWPELGAIPNPKDPIENAMNKAVCAGKVTLATAQQEFESNWTQIRVPN